MISKDQNSQKPNGLVLAGGKSSRLGIDKTLIFWHEEPQVIHQYKMLGKFCDQVFISKQHGDERLDLPQIIDAFNVKGPYAGILSAFNFAPSVAWLVVACDLPLLNEIDIQKLIHERDPQKVATAYISPRDGSPEPLAAIWEPKSFAILKELLEQGYTCPRKVLMLNDIKNVEPENKESLKNVNRMEDFDEVKLILSKRKEIA